MKSTYLDNYFYQNPNTFNAVRKPINTALQVDVLVEPAQQVNSNFQIMSEKNGSEFLLDQVNGMGRINWNGQVDIHTAKKLLRTAFDAISFHNCTKLILDHSQLIVFDTEARVWVKELISYKAESVNDKLVKMASISPKSSIGSMFSNFAGEILKDELPHLTMKRFDNLEDALYWLG